MKFLLTLLTALCLTVVSTHAQQSTLGGLKTGNNIWIDAVYGSDLTGGRGNAGKPFLTMTGGLAVAVAGDMVNVAPGTYNCGTNGVLRRNVNYYFSPGSYLLWSNMTMTADVYCLFDDRQTGATTNYISGGGTFFATAYNSQTDDANFNLRGLLVVTNTRSEVWFQGAKAMVSAPTTLGAQGYFAALHTLNGIVHWDVPQVIDPFVDDGTHASYGMGFYWWEGQQHVRVDRVLMQNYYCFWGHDPNPGTAKGNFWCDGNLVVSTNGVAIYTESSAAVGSPEYKSWFNIKEVKGGLIGYSVVGLNRVYVSGQKVSGAIPIDSGGFSWMNIEKVSGTNGLMNLRGGENFISVQQWDDLSPNGVSGAAKVVLYAGINKVMGGHYRANNTNALWFCEVRGGTNYADGLVLDLTNAGGTNGWGFYAASTNENGLTLKDCSIKTSNATSNSVFATNLQTVILEGTLTANTNWNPNVSILGGVPVINRVALNLANSWQDDASKWRVANMMNAGSAGTFTAIGDAATITQTGGSAIFTNADANWGASVIIHSSGSQFGHGTVSGNQNWRTGRYLQAATRSGVTNTANLIWWFCLTDNPVGLAQLTNAPAGNYVGFRYSTTAGDATIKCVTGNNGTTTVTDSGVVVDTLPHVLEFKMDDAGSNVVFRIDGMFVQTNRANLPPLGTVLRYLNGAQSLVSTTNALRCEQLQVKSRNY